MNETETDIHADRKLTTCITTNNGPVLLSGRVRLKDRAELTAGDSPVLGAVSLGKPSSSSAVQVKFQYRREASLLPAVLIVAGPANKATVYSEMASQVYYTACPSVPQDQLHMGMELKKHPSGLFWPWVGISSPKELSHRKLTVEESIHRVFHREN